MKISGLQKLTTLDYPGKVACTIFTQGCNMYCSFCHNSELISYGAKTQYTEKDILDFLESRKGKLDAVCISGGEPTMQHDILDFVKKVSNMGFCVKIDTNGTNPDILAQLVSSGFVSYVAMDVKNIPKKYKDTCGIPILLANINSSIVILNNNNVDHEFRTTVSPSFIEPEDIHKIATWVRGCDKYYIQKFIMRDTVMGKTFEEPTDEFMKLCLQEARKIIPTAELRGVE